jgi:hypothetical protein
MVVVSFAVSSAFAQQSTLPGSDASGPTPSSYRVPKFKPGLLYPLEAPSLALGTEPGQSAPADFSQDQSNAQAPADTDTPVNNQQQPKRILGIMPNFRAVSAGAVAPPPTAKHAFKIATENSFDYSSSIFVGITSAMAEWSNSHPQLGEGMAGYGRYYWRGFLDKTDGNYLVIFALPTVLHEDERYYAMGEGGIWKRGTYSATRVFVARDYHGRNTVNLAELLGRAAAQAISVSYYPSKTRTASAISQKYAWSIGRDALTNTFREFWPDIATHVLHRHP